MGSLELDALPETFSLVADQITAPVEGMHGVISSRAFRYTPAAGGPIQRLHDAAVGSVYRSIPPGAAAIGAVAGALWGARSSVERPVSETEAGSRWQAVLNATWGDRLADDCSPLAIETSFRRETRAVSPARVAEQLEGMRSHAVLLLHGIGQTESCWQAPGGMAEAIGADVTLLPVLVRYNSGRSVEEIGTEVAALIEALWRAAPDTEVSLVGFSMGGLVARAAYATAVESKLRSASALRHIVTVGTPHSGSYLARTARFAAAGLASTRTTKPLASFLDGRSAAIRDLEWADGADRLPLMPSVRHHFVAATVTGERHHPVGVVFGDLVVRVRSATAPAVASDNVSVVGGRHHGALLTDDEVQSRIVGWLRSAGDD